MSGNEVRERRMALHLTQVALAEALGVSATTIARWEREEREIPAMLNLALSQVARLAGGSGPVLPAGPFEQRLFLRLIRAELAAWMTLPIPLRASVGTYQADGTWLLVIEDGRERPFDPMAMFSAPQVVGRVWLESDPLGESVVSYSIPTTEYGPAMSYPVGLASPDITFPVPV